MGKGVACSALMLLLFFCADCRAGMQCVPPARPDMPSANADSGEMERAGKEVTVYVAKMKEYRECLLKIVNDADNELASVVEGWNYAVERFKGSRSGGPGSEK